MGPRGTRFKLDQKRRLVIYESWFVSASSKIVYSLDTFLVDAEVS